MFPALHAAVPSLVSLRLDLTVRYLPHPRPAIEFFNAFGNHCPHIEKLVINTMVSSIVDTKISPQICRWPNLRQVHCLNVTLNMDAIVHLSSISKLKSLEFTVHADATRDLSHFGSILVFSNLVELRMDSKSLDTAALLLSRIRLPAIESLSVTISNYTSKRQIQAYWAGVRTVCPSNLLTSFGLEGFGQDYGTLTLGEEALLRLTWEDLYPCTAFAELRELCINFDCSVGLTDADLLELASLRMEELVINYELGWQIGNEGGGITLSGLVQLLQKCPALKCLTLAIDTWTFTEIPEGMDVSFPPREQLTINFLDSYILPEFVPDLVTVFMALGLDSSMFTFWNIRREGYEVMQARSLWESVQDELRVLGEQSLLSEV